MLEKQAIGVPGLNVMEILVYTPTNIVGALLEPSQLLSIGTMKSAISDIQHTGVAEYDATLDVFRYTNAVPQPPQAQILRSIRASCEADLLDLDAEILCLQKTIVELSQKLAEVSTKRFQKEKLSSLCSSFLSPLRSLPPETLGEIFLRCMPANGRAITEAPLSISQVCSMWRNVSIGVPQLWSNLSFICGYGKTEAAIRNTIHTTKLWFERAKKSPLTFSFEASSNYLERDLEGIVDLVFLFASDLCRLHLSITGSGAISRLLTIPSGRFQSLEFLNLSYTGPQDDLVSAFDEAPLLRELVLDVYIRGSLKKFRLPWDQLTSITIHGMASLSQIEFYKTLQSCNQLVSGSFQLFSPSLENIHHNDALVVLENLVNLVVEVDYEAIEALQFDIFHLLVFPSLATFELKGKYAQTLNLSNFPLVVFLQRAKAVRSLCLLHVYASPDNILPILHSTPYLMNLRLELIAHDRGFNTLIKALTYTDTQSSIVLVPLLESFDVDFMTEYGNDTVPQIDQRAFIAMIQSRQIRGASAAYLTVRLQLRVEGSRFLPPFDLLRNARDIGSIEIEVGI